MRYQFFTNKLIISAWVLCTVTAGTGFSAAQQTAKTPVTFKTPSGYMPAPLSGHTGQLFLDAKKPGGMFIGYPKEGQDMNSFADEIKGIVSGMFLHDKKELLWASAPLPAHKGIESESGTLLTTSDPDMEVQLAFYTRSEGVAYGYFAMRHTKPKGDDAKFLDASGAGVKAFDEFAKTISSKERK